MQLLLFCCSFNSIKNIYYPHIIWECTAVGPVPPDRFLWALTGICSAISQAAAMAYRFALRTNTEWYSY